MKLDKLRELNEQILALVADEDIESKIEQCDQFTDRIWQMVFRIEYKISARERSTVLHSSSSDVSPTVVPDIVAVSSNEAPVSSSELPVGSSDSVLTTSDAIPPAHRTTTAVPDTSRTTVTSSTVTPVTHHVVTKATSSRVKLPKLEPKKFNGDLNKWETFLSSFESSIHTNPTLTAVDKFQYLISLL